MGNAFSCLHGPVERQADVQHAHDKATPALPVKGVPAASYGKSDAAAALQQVKGSEEEAAAKDKENDTGGTPESGKESGIETDPDPVSAMFPSTGGYPYQGYELGPPPTYDEPARLQALRAVDVLDSVTTGRGVRLDEEAAMVLATVMKAFRAATAMLVFIGESRIIVRNSLGIVPTGEFPYRWSLCAYTLSKQHPQTLVIPDASKDVRFADNPFVAKAPGVRFYAGAPVLSSSGQALGTLCFADTSPRPNFDAGQCRLLNNLAEVVARAVERLGPGAGVAGSKDAETTALARVARTTECFEAVTGLVDVGSGAPGAAGAPALGRSRSMRSRGGAPGSQGGWVVMYVNEAWEALVEGRSRRSMVGRPLQQLLELEAEAEPRGEAGEQGEAETATPAEAAGIPVSATPSLTSASSRPSTPESLAAAEPKPSHGLLPHSPRSPHHPNGFPIRKLRSVSLRLREGKTHYRRSTSFAGSATSSARSRASPTLRTRPVDAAAAARWAEAAAAARAGQVVDLGCVRLLTADGKPTGKRAFMQLRPANSHILDAATRMPVGIPPQLALPASILEAAPPPAPGSPAPGSPAAAHTAATYAAAALHDGSVHFSSLDGAVSGQPPPPAPSAPRASAPQIASGTSSRFGTAAAAVGFGTGSGSASDATESTPPASGGSQRAAPSPAAVRRSEPGAVAPSAGPCYCFVTLTPLPDEDDDAAADFDVDGRISEEHATAPASPPLAVPTTPSTSVRLPALCSTANAGALPSATTRPGSITSGAAASPVAGSSRRGGGGAGGSVPGDPTSGWKYGDEPLPGLRLGHLLGKGGYGKVFSATYRGEKVAAKVVSNSMLYAAASVNNVSLEALMAQEIEHPFLVRTIKCVVRMYGTGGSGELDTQHSVHVSPSAPSPLAVIPALVAPPPPSNGASGDPPTPSFATTIAPANAHAANAAPVISSAKPLVPPPGGQPPRPGSLDLPSQGLPPPSTPSLLASGLEISDALAQAGRSLPSETLNAARSEAPGIAAAAGAVAAGMAVAEAAQAAAPAPPAPPPPPAALPAPPSSDGPAVAAQQQQRQQQQSAMEFDSFDMVSGQETSESCGMVVSMIDHLSPGGMGLGGHHLPPSALARTAPTIYEDAELTDTDPLPICGSHVGGAASAATHVVCPPGTGAAHGSRAHPAAPMLPSPMHPGRPGASWRPADGPIGHASAPQRRSVDLGSRGSAGGVVSPGVVVPAAGIAAAATGSARGSGGGPSGGTQGASSASQGRGGPKLAEGETWFVMEFCSRGTLQDAIDQGHLRTEPSRLRGEPHLPHILLTAQEVASAMGCLHSRGYLHGDLSAVNVLLADVSQAAAAAGVAAAAGPAPALLAGPASSRGWVAKVSDLGLAKGLPEPDAVHVSAVCGVITHCAPEVLRSHMQTQKSDVYSFGVLLWQCWTGSRPFSGMNRFQILGAVTSASGPPLRFLPSQRPPRRYEDLTLRCLSPNPQDRPSFVEVVEDIRQLIVEVAAAGLLQA